MSLFVVTEPLAYMRRLNDFDPRLHSTLYPGLVDGDTVRRELGDELFDAAVASGVLVPAVV